MAKGGEMFVLDMGNPIKIKDLAFKMIELSGLQPYLEGNTSNIEGDIAVRVSGLRPGEKMYEELSYGDNLVGTEHPRIMTVNEKTMSPKRIHELMVFLERLIVDKDYDGLFSCLAEYADYKIDENTFKTPPILTHVSKTKQSNGKIFSFKR